MVVCLVPVCYLLIQVAASLIFGLLNYQIKASHDKSLADLEAREKDLVAQLQALKKHQ